LARIKAAEEREKTWDKRIAVAASSRKQKIQIVCTYVYTSVIIKISDERFASIYVSA
jgi:hypothetical protein